MKQTWLDCYLGKFKLYRRLKGGSWFLHEFTIDAEQITFRKGNRFWARYGELNRYTKVIKQESYEKL